MAEVLTILVVGIAALCAGGYVGYKYGAKFEQKATAEKETLKQVASDSKKLV